MHADQIRVLFASSWCSDLGCQPRPSRAPSGCRRPPGNRNPLGLNMRIHIWRCVDGSCPLPSAASRSVTWNFPFASLAGSVIPTPRQRRPCSSVNFHLNCMEPLDLFAATAPSVTGPRVCDVPDLMRSF